MNAQDLRARLNGGGLTELERAAAYAELAGASTEATAVRIIAAVAELEVKVAALERRLDAREAADRG